MNTTTRGRDLSRQALIASALALLLTLAASAAFATEQTNPAPASSAPATDAPASAPAEQAPTCVHGCQRWGKLCNVDPRGVYKCQRRCEKFGEICE